jgi:hypothetical protein
MSRLRDYLGFSVRFVGLGYIALWPLSTPGRGDMFGAALVCHERVGRVLDLVCGWPHPLRLSIGLHVTSALCAVLAMVHLCAVAAHRARRRRRGPPASVPVEAGPSTVPSPRQPRMSLRLRRRPLPPPRKFVPPRAHFGLRGLPQ